MIQFKKYVTLFSLMMMAASCDQASKLENEMADDSFHKIPNDAIMHPYEDNKSRVHVRLMGPNKEVEHEGDYLNEQKEGAWITYHYNGAIKEINNYDKGVLEGVHIESSELGQITLNCFYHNGLLNGRYRKFKSNTIIEDKNYRNGKIQGAVKLYYPNGTLMEESFYRNGIRDGEAKWFDREGNVSIEYFYKEGKRVNGN